MKKQNKKEKLSCYISYSFDYFPPPILTNFLSLSDILTLKSFPLSFYSLSKVLSLFLISISPLFPLPIVLCLILVVIDILSNKDIMLNDVAYPFIFVSPNVSLFFLLLIVFSKAHN